MLRQTLLLDGNTPLQISPVYSLETDESWSPCLSLEDAYKLDDVREALRRKDIATASRLARVYTIHPVTG